MSVHTREAAKALSRARWGDRPRAADRALDVLDLCRDDLKLDQVDRLQRLAAGTPAPTATDQPEGPT